MYNQHVYEMINNYQEMMTNHTEVDLLCPQVHFSDYKPVEFCSREWKEIYNLIYSSKKFITPKMMLQNHTSAGLASMTHTHTHTQPYNIEH